MCTRPITITRNYPLVGSKTYTVPCGKCPDCLRKKQAEFNALALHAGLKFGSCYMFTLTYRNDSVPVAHSRFVDGEACIFDFSRGIADDEFISNHLVDHGGSYEALSLRREDVKTVIKRFRTHWKNDFPSVPLEWKYACFGEYGEHRGRPHYHLLAFGLTPKQAEYFKNEWASAFGFAHCGPVPGAPLSQVDIIKISSYASKYISKGVCSAWDYLMPFVEKPRRQSSINFAMFTDSELRQLSNFMTDAIYCEDFQSLAIWVSSSILSYLDVRPFSLPDEISLSQKS